MAVKLDPNLQIFNVKATYDLDQEARFIAVGILANKKLESTTHNLALLTLASFVALLALISWNWLTEVETWSLSSTIFAVYNLVIGIFALWYWIDLKLKTRHIAAKIDQLVQKTHGKCYVQRIRKIEDTETPKEIKMSIEQNLRQLCAQKIKDTNTPPEIKKSIEEYLQRYDQKIETSFQFIVTYEITVTAEPFKYDLSKETEKCNNLDEVKKALKPWRAVYAVKSEEGIPETLLTVIASQCIQGLPEITITDTSFEYKCISPPIDNPAGGSIKAGAQKLVCKTPQELFTFINTLPRVKSMGVDKAPLFQSYMSHRPPSADSQH